MTKKLRHIDSLHSIKKTKIYRFRLIVKIRTIQFSINSIKDLLKGQNNWKFFRKALRQKIVMHKRIHINYFKNYFRKKLVYTHQSNNLKEENLPKKQLPGNKYDNQYQNSDQLVTREQGTLQPQSSIIHGEL